FGLYISPDMDTVCYTLAGISNEKTGWGRKNESFNVLDQIKQIGGPDWFMLGDKDIAFHLERTRLMKLDHSLTDISLELEKSIGITHNVLPMCNEKVSTIVNTEEYKEISFQEYFVKYQFLPKVNGFRFDGIKDATITEEVERALIDADAIVLCPSNPFVSIYPILSIDGIIEILSKKYVIAVSPIIGGAAVKGPLAKIMVEFGMDVHPASIIEMYHEFLDCFYMDDSDRNLDLGNIPSGIILKYENILLPDIESRKNLAQSILNTIKENNR
ncbi:MAG: YvcK family protein, partial [Proteobacteria bacterium]|nr:YvcK family protein [Pseudomonadota bacterium]